MSGFVKNRSPFEGKLRWRHTRSLVQSRTCDPGKSVPVVDTGSTNKFPLRRKKIPSVCRSCILAKTNKQTKAKF